VYPTQDGDSSEIATKLAYVSDVDLKLIINISIVINTDK
jgi:hypothetical protein